MEMQPAEANPDVEHELINLVIAAKFKGEDRELELGRFCAMLTVHLDEFFAAQSGLDSLVEANLRSIHSNRQFCVSIKTGAPETETDAGGHGTMDTIDLDDDSIDEIVADIEIMIRRKWFKDKRIVRFSFTYDNKWVFTLKTWDGSPSTTGEDVAALQNMYWPKFGRDVIDFDYEQLRDNFEFIDMMPPLRRPTVSSALHYMFKSLRRAFGSTV